MKQMIANKPGRGAFSVTKCGRISGARIALVGGCLLALVGSATHSAAEDRTLKLYFGHTGERAVITFKRNGVFDQAGLNQLNQFLRDWRANKSAKMDPRLFDIVWEVYRRSGASDYINVVSGYRSPNTNAMLRTHSTGVAKESQHTHGGAIDFFIPRVKLATLRSLAIQIQGGGVGYYPTSGSPFVHVDVGGVRAWPRMRRQELVQLFPNGKTLHIPSDGRPLPGYEAAVAEYTSRGTGSSVEIASFGGGKGKGNFLAALFVGTNAEEEDDVAESALPSTSKIIAQPAKAEQSVGVASVEQPLKFTAPVPARRPDNAIILTALRPTMPTEHEAFAAVTSATSVETDETASFEHVSSYQIPLPVFASRPSQADRMITASTSKIVDTVQASAGSVMPLRRERAAVLVDSDRVMENSFRPSFTTGYPAQNGFQPMNATATFDFGRFGDAPAK